jgi:DNA-binding response OmpR family regulator
MIKNYNNIIVLSSDPFVSEAFKSLILAISCRPILVNNYQELILAIETEDAIAVLLDEYINTKEGKVLAKEAFKNYKYKIPLVFVLEGLEDIHNSHPLKLYIKKPIDTNLFKNALAPYLDIKNLSKKYPLIKIGNFSYDKNLNILIDEKKIIVHLTNLESKLLATFFENYNNILSEKFLLKKVWGYSSEVNSNTIKTHIWRLRKKISNKYNTTFILETTKNGYVLKDK